jgi:Tfp pilus assembly protein PilF
MFFVQQDFILATILQAGDYAAAREHLKKAIDVAPADQKKRRTTPVLLH